MSINPSPMEPLSIGNVVSAGLRLYRSHFQTYAKLVCNAYIWLLVPIYGWAKFGAILALISRLAFGELVNQPESVTSGRSFVNSRMWQFLVLGLLTFAIYFGLIIVLLIPFVFVTLLVSAGAAFGHNSNPALFGVVGLLIIVLVPILLTVLFWVQARLFVSQIPLAIEENIDALSSISRSWDLTKGQVWRIIGVLLVGYLISLPIQLPLTALSYIIHLYLQPLIRENSGYSILSSLASIIISLISALLLVPFWQSIRTVVYCDLRTRREGFGLNLRDHEI